MRRGGGCASGGGLAQLGGLRRGSAYERCGRPGAPRVLLPRAMCSAPRPASARKVAPFVSAIVWVRVQRRGVATSSTPLAPRKTVRPGPALVQEEEDGEAKEDEEDEEEDEEPEVWSDYDSDDDEQNEEEWEEEEEEEEGEEDIDLPSLRRAVEERQERLMNSKKWDINKKDVTPEGRLGMEVADEDMMIAEDDEEEVVDQAPEDEGTTALLEMEDTEDAANSRPGKRNTREVAVASGDGDMRLDRWLKTKLPQLPNSLFQKLLRKRKIRVITAEEQRQGANQTADAEGEGAAPSKKKKPDGKYRLSPGDLVTYPAYLENLGKDDALREQRQIRPLSDAETQLAQSWVIYKDDRLLALNKPPGLPVQGGSDVGDNHLGKYLAALKYDKEELPRLVHRLDKECSGVLIMGRSRGDAAYFTSLFKKKQVAKQYWAVLAGVPNPRAGRISAPIKELNQGTGVAESMKEEGAKMAITRYETLGEAGNEISFVEMWPWTGRKHQLRVHCAQVLKAPILGDQKYGTSELFEKFKIMLNTVDNLHLHCRSLEIPHPIKKNQRLKIVAAPPNFFKQTIARFSFSDRVNRTPQRSPTIDAKGNAEKPPVKQKKNNKPSQGKKKATRERK